MIKLVFFDLNLKQLDTYSLAVWLLSMFGPGCRISLTSLLALISSPLPGGGLVMIRMGC
jgi:hypothetical protein